MNYFIDVVKKYAVFSGRARRSEYWFFILFYTILSIVLSYVDAIAGLMIVEGVGMLSSLLALGLLLPSIGVTIRRLHDSGKSGWWLLFMMIPIIGWIVGLIFMVLGSSEGDNKYGANPISA